MIEFLTILSQVLTSLGVIVTMTVAILNRNKLHALEVHIDGRMADLLAATKAKAAAEGNLLGRAEQTQERKVEHEHG